MAGLELRDQPRITSILMETTAVKGKSIAEVKSLFAQVHDMVTTGKSNGDLGKLAVFVSVHKFPARVKCAILPWHAAVAAVEGQSDPFLRRARNSLWAILEYADE